MHLTCVLLFLVGCYTTLAAICPTNWQRYGESCYLLITQPLKWTDANDTCCKLNAALVLPKSQSEQTFIWNMFKRYFNGKPAGGLWIGCNDIKEEGNWQPCPMRGVSNAYENWSKDYENDKPKKDCAIMSRQGGRWVQRKCSREKLSACELPVDVTIPVFSLQTGLGGRVESQCLVGHVMKELRDDGVVSCGKACRSEPRCRSFNLLIEQGSGKMVCQLNNATRYEAADGNMKARDKCYFFDL